LRPGILLGLGLGGGTADVKINTTSDRAKIKIGIDNAIPILIKNIVKKSSIIRYSTNNFYASFLAILILVLGVLFYQSPLKLTNK